MKQVWRIAGVNSEEKARAENILQKARSGERCTKFMTSVRHCRRRHLRLPSELATHVRLFSSVWPSRHLGCFFAAVTFLSFSIPRVCNVKQSKLCSLMTISLAVVNVPLHPPAAR